MDDKYLENHPCLVEMLQEGWVSKKGVNTPGLELYELRERWRIYDHNECRWILESAKGAFKLELDESS